jgi:hypothetical protein
MDSAPPAEPGLVPAAPALQLRPPPASAPSDRAASLPLPFDPESTDASRPPSGAPPSGAAAHTSLVQMPERQTRSPLIGVHGPTPLGSPHLLSVVSQTPLTQTDAPTAGLHTPALWSGSFETAVPLGSFGVQVNVLPLQKLVAAQSVSLAQPLVAGTQLPEPTPHVPERQTCP